MQTWKTSAAKFVLLVTALVVSIGGAYGRNLWIKFKIHTSNFIRTMSSEPKRKVGGSGGENL